MRTSPPHYARRSRRTLIAGLVVAVMGGTWLVALRPARTKPAVVAPEVGRKDLAIHEARWYRLGQTNPFTGWMADYYPNGARLFRSEVSNGLLNGVSEGWYTNGQIQIRERYKDSVADGLRQKWHANGQLMSEATIVEGRLEGTFRRWHENGQLAEQIEMKNDKPDGLARAFYPSGFLQCETQVRAGVVVARHSRQDREQRVSE